LGSVSPRATVSVRVIASIRVFRTGLVREFAEYDRRDWELEELSGE
jgi:hypothetical protein